MVAPPLPVAVPELPVLDPLPDVVPLVAPPEPDPVEEEPPLPDDPPRAGVVPEGELALGPHGSAAARADDPLGADDPLAVVVPAVPLLLEAADPLRLLEGWSATAPLPDLGPVSVAVFTGSFEDVVVPVELFVRLDDDAASATLVPDVPERPDVLDAPGVVELPDAPEVPDVPVAPDVPEVPDAVAPLRADAVVPSDVDPAVPAPAGPHGSVDVPRAPDEVVPVP